MKQLTQNLKSGEMEISEVPFPALNSKNILVRNYFSLISAGTEGSKVLTARKGYIGKAKERPEQVKQVLETIKKEGFLSAYNKVMNKLDALSPIGYSSAGEVIEVGSEVTEFKVGDRVSCSGQDIANHAEVVSVPINLACRLPINVKYEEATYTTVASIALQGFRQADLKLGENCLVIGLGLIGQLTVQLLKASGVKVIGLDVNEDMVKLSKKSGVDLVFQRNDAEVEQAIFNFTNGFGVDAVIITAGTSSLDPVEFAGKVARQKGKIVIVGAVPTGFSRENYYKKELELRMSTSYGPGRYNINYEDKGLDYPIGYVRWTENRNMQAFLDLVAQEKVNLGILTTHIFDFLKAKEAYQMIVDKSEFYVGILLKYDVEKELIKTIDIKESKPLDEKIKIGFIGAGSFAQNYLLPNIKNANLVTVATSQGHTSKSVAQKYGFNNATCDTDDVIQNNSINTVFIATRHNTHASNVLKSIKAGKNVFVEKPLCMNNEELQEIKNEYEKQNVHLMVGFNRRFAPHIIKVKELFKSNQPKAINYRINAGFIPLDHWTQDKEIGGGRIIGEVCHFVDLAMFLSSSSPSSLNAFAMETTTGLLDTLVANIKFKDGSIASISYFANGSKELKKEYLEIFSNGVTVVLDDFKELIIYDKKRKINKLISQDKGHKKEIELFLEAIIKGEKTPIPFNDIYYSTKMSFDIIDSIRLRKTIIYD